MSIGQVSAGDALRALAERSVLERVAAATSLLRTLPVEARLHATTDALTEAGGDAAASGSARAAAERTLAALEPPRLAPVVDRLARHLDRPTRLEHADQLLDDLHYEDRDRLLDRWRPTDPAAAAAAGDAETADGRISLVSGSDGMEDSAAMLGRACALVDRLAAETLSGAVDDGALAVSVDGLVILGRKVDAERMRRLDETAQRGTHGARSTADMLRDRHGITGSAARRQVETAQRLRQLPATTRRLQDGGLDVDHAEQAGRAAEQVRQAARRGELTKPQADRLVGEVDRAAAATGPGEQPAALRRRLDVLTRTGGALDLEERARRHHRDRRFWLSASRQAGEDGMTAVTGALPPEMAARLRAALEPNAGKRGRDDERTPQQRMADALDQLTRPHTPATGRPARAGDVNRPAGPAGSPTRPSGPAAPSGTDEPDDATGAALNARRTDTAEEDGDGLPVVPATQVLLITTLEGLAGKPDAEPPWLDGHGSIASATARLLTCDAELTPIVFDSTGRPLDVGRTRRLATDEQRLAVAARDRSCVGCHAPITRTQVHHHRWWGRDRGRTDLDNLCLLCTACHTNVHLGHWQTTRQPDGTFTAGPVRRAGPAPPNRPSAEEPPPGEGDTARAGPPGAVTARRARPSPDAAPAGRDDPRRPPATGPSSPSPARPPALELLPEPGPAPGHRQHDNRGFT